MSSKALDVYRDWLGIKDPARPLNHYQLLRLTQFEDDPAKVRKHYREMNAHVRKFAAGEYASQSQALLNELAKAMLTLTDATRKSEYDASLGREQKADGSRRTFEELLVYRKVMAPEQLDKARSLSQALGLEIRDAVLQQKLAKPEDVMQAYAESLGLPYVELADVGLDEELIPKIPAVIARQNSAVPVMIDGGRILMASPNPINPEVEENLRLRLGMPIRTVLCTPASVTDVITRHYPKELAAAQMAAVPGAVSSAVAADRGGPSLTAEERKSVKKQKQLGAIIAFNMTLMVYFLTTSIFQLALKWGWVKFLGLGLMAGVTVACLTLLLYRPKPQ